MLSLPSSLPEIPGRFPVGATTFFTRVSSPRAVGRTTLRNQQPHAPQAALFFEEVAFTAYYPADTSRLKRKGLDWIIRPLKEFLRGFAKFTRIPYWVLWPIVYLFGSFIQIPVYPNAPLANPRATMSSDKEETGAQQWPLVIFSHGLGGSRTAYSQICSRLAASGKVILALEHRDGTGCACVTRVREPVNGSQTKSILYYRDDDVILENTCPNPAPLPLRTDQLEFRREEIYTAYKTFRDFLQNDCSSELEAIDNSQIDYNSWSCIDPASGKRPVCFDTNVTLAGHSFGGCTVLSILSTHPLWNSRTCL
ncbi:putative platelet-activating factor acetylhydrolase, isoform II [Lyophyllum shimeji]|uniref:1-alkyl-2-acetylglycerophosphocholine esterase n=1 Tax=Lyophyllum shimeji TaxID=47721 RepID=A0A9P3UK15_LYOSH|nr:putative platelet-activating factor acetylhydrolase, isoform II [Lyophyllum shimeji]